MSDTALLLTEPEAAARLRLSARVLRQARQEGLLRYILRGRSVRYTIADLESYIDQLRQVQPPCSTPVHTKPRAQGRRAGAGVIIPFSERRRAKSIRERL